MVVDKYSSEDESLDAQLHNIEKLRDPPFREKHILSSAMYTPQSFLRSPPPSVDPNSPLRPEFTAAFMNP
jgi:hypothetical protein